MAGKNNRGICPTRTPCGLKLLVWVLVSCVATFAARAGEAEPPVRKGPSPLVDNGGRYPEVLAYDNGDVSTWAEFFIFDSPTHPKLVQLRQEYGLDEVVKDAKTDLERAVILKNWTAGHLKFGTPTPEVFSDWSAVALLERAKRGQEVWCGQAAMVFQQACMAMGMPARFIELGVPDNPACHFTTEVFLREHDKWAVVDATPLDAYNCYYTVDGVPQSALEMHRHVVKQQMDKVAEVHADRTHPVRSPRSPAWAFYYVRWLTRCDIVTHTPRFVHMENVFDRTYGTVEWVDADTVPWEKQKQSTWWTRNERLSVWNTSDPEVVNWRPSGRTRIVLSSFTEGYCFLHLWNADAGFDHYQANVDGSGWVDLPKGNVQGGRWDQFGWGLNRLSVRARRPGTHRVQVRTVRQDGSQGSESFVQFRIQ